MTDGADVESGEMYSVTARAAGYTLGRFEMFEKMLASRHVTHGARSCCC